MILVMVNFLFDFVPVLAMEAAIGASKPSSHPLTAASHARQLNPSSRKVTIKRGKQRP